MYVSVALSLDIDMTAANETSQTSTRKSSSALDIAAVSWIVAPRSENMCGIKLERSLHQASE